LNINEIDEYIGADGMLKKKAMLVNGACITWTPAVCKDSAHARDYANIVHGRRIPWQVFCMSFTAATRLGAADLFYFRTGDTR